MELAEKFARFVVGTEFRDVDDSVTEYIKKLTLKQVMGMLVGSAAPTSKKLIRYAKDNPGRPECGVYGCGFRTDVAQAALLNGATSHTFDFDDTHLKTVIHPSGPVASAILALAEHQPVSGRDFLHAFILGVEAECRIGNAIYPNHYDTGWHITATAGVFGAAAASGRLLKLNEQQTVWALGTAATQACGIRETFGTMAKPLHPGIAARNGLLSALLAKKNVTSAEQGIEGRRGFAAILSTKFDAAAITEGLGASWEISSNSYKPYACGVVIHPAIDGCIQLRNEHKLQLDDVDRIDLKVHPLVLELTGRRTPPTGLEGKFSIYHSCAAAILLGEGGEAAFSDAIVRNPTVMRLRDQVHAVVQAGVQEDQVHITMTLKDGRVLEKFIEHAVGSLARPMSDADLEAKFRALCKGLLPAAQVDKLIRLCWNVGKLKRAAEIARASVPARATAKAKTKKR